MDAGNALDLAQRMSILDNYPRSDKAVGQIGELIYGLCKTDEQLTWLKREVLSGKFTKWQGPGWLKDIFTSRFPVTETKPESHFQATDCPYCGGSGWRVSKQVGLYECVSRCDHHGITPKPLVGTGPLCRVCQGWGTIRDKAGIHQFCLCSAGQTLRESDPRWLEFMARLEKNAVRRREPATGPVRSLIANMEKGYIEKKERA